MNIESPVKDGTPVSFELGEDYPELRDAVRRICQKYPGEYWRALEDRSEYPTAFVADLTAGGYLAALIPQDYGGAGLPIRAAAVILEETVDLRLAANMFHDVAPAAFRALNGPAWAALTRNN